VPTPTLERVRRALRRRADLVRHRGTAVQCPLCGGRFDRFKPAWNRPEALCWRCGAHERHRAQWLLLTQRPELLGWIGSLLHFAPEWTMRERLAPLTRARGIRYLTADLDPAGVDRRLDVTRLDLPDHAFDAVMCSHVLEHVPDDAAAMGELCRVTAPGGWCLVMVPLDVTRAHTYEDPAVVTPEARAREFLQHDHVRLYAPDIADRLAAAGFAVEVVRPDDLGPDAVRRAGLLASDWIFLCRPAAAGLRDPSARLSTP
jgi:SAM-dependent methyltransferase